MGPEYARRRQQHGAALLPLRKGILSKPYVPPRTAARYVDALSNSKLLYQCESWPVRNKTAHTQIDAQYMKGYRAAAKCEFQHGDTSQMTNHWALMTTERMPVDDVVRTRRLKYLASIITSGPASLRFLLDTTWSDPAAWTAQLHDDFRWIHSVVRDAAAPEADNTRGWVQFIRQHTSAYLKLISKAWQAHVQATLEDLRIEDWRRQLNRCAWVAEQPETSGGYVCYTCHDVFHSVKAWRRHQTTAHSIRLDARRYAIGTRCMACGTTYDTRKHLLYHLRYRGAGCLETIAEMIAPISETEAEALDAVDRSTAEDRVKAGHLPHKVYRNAIKPDLAQRRQLRGQKVRTVHAPWTEFSMPQQSTTRERPPLDRFPLVAILHLFSGRRREHDFQAHFEKLAAGTNAVVLSLDIIYGHRGDLLDNDNVAYWASYIRSGRVIGLLGGPPCESWSAARGRPIERTTGTTRNGPRQLRNRFAPWGLRDVTPSERKQLHTANQLLRAMIHLMYVAVDEGVSGVMEHPATPWWSPDCASSWLLDEVVRLRRHSAATFVYVDQCCFGACYRKPTRFLCINLPELEGTLQAAPGRGKCPHTGGHGAAIGTDRQGNFVTSHLKEYPSQLCEWLAKGFFTRWANALHTTTDDWSDHCVQPYYVPLDPYMQHVQGKDYARGRRRQRSITQWILDGDSDHDSSDDHNQPPPTTALRTLRHPPPPRGGHRGA